MLFLVCLLFVYADQKSNAFIVVAKLAILQQLLNSLMSILSFNHFDFRLEEGEKRCINPSSGDSLFTIALQCNVIIVVTLVGGEKDFVLYA